MRRARPNAARIVVIACAPRTLCAITAFFLRPPGLRAGSRPPWSYAEGAFEFPNPGVDLAQLAGRDDILTGLDGRRRARFREPRPAADHAGRDVELTTELGQGLLPAQDALDRCSLELRAEPTLAGRVPRMLALGTSRE